MKVDRRSFLTGVGCVCALLVTLLLIAFVLAEWPFNHSVRAKSARRILLNAITRVVAKSPSKSPRLAAKKTRPKAKRPIKNGPAVVPQVSAVAPVISRKPKNEGTKVASVPVKPPLNPAKAEERKVRKQYYLFDRRGPEEVRSLSNRYLRDSANGNMVVSDLQDHSREYEVPKARFFVEYYEVPTKEKLDSSDSLRMPNSPGYQEK